MVLAINHQIEQQHRRWDCDPGRGLDKVEQTPAFGPGRIAPRSGTGTRSLPMKAAVRAEAGRRPWTQTYPAP